LWDGTPVILAAEISNGVMRRNDKSSLKELSASNSPRCASKALLFAILQSGGSTSPVGCSCSGSDRQGGFFRGSYTRATAGALDKRRIALT
jgi:hypothetical protein